MATRKIVTDEESVLYRKSRRVTDFNARLHTLLDDMRETLAVENGLGLAAPQVGVLRRAVLVVDTGREEGDPVIELVNPELVEIEGEQSGPEGCLSVPGRWGIVKRPMNVKVKAHTRDGEEFTLEAEGLTARACCHEIDHLDGHIFTEIMEKELTEEEIMEMRGIPKDMYAEE